LAGLDVVLIENKGFSFENSILLPLFDSIILIYIFNLNAIKGFWGFGVLPGLWFSTSQSRHSSYFGQVSSLRVYADSSLSD
jgi:hypothetical protein